MEDFWECLQLRRAGGKNYLIDNEKAGMPYHKPIVVNDTGAELFQGLSEGLSREEVIKRTAQEYGIAQETVRKDLEDFLNRLKAQYEVWR